MRSAHPYPFNLCCCSICRKTGGGGGYAINLGADYESLEVEGEEYRSVYNAVMREEISQAQRSFCALCGTSLWLWDPHWPDLVHPLASAIDTELPRPPECTHLMLADKPSWVEARVGPKDRQFDGYPEESLAEWHERLGPLPLRLTPPEVLGPLKEGAGPFAAVAAWHASFKDGPTLLNSPRPWIAWILKQGSP